MRAALRAQGVDVGGSTSQVIPVMVRDDHTIFAVTRELEREGVYLNPILYPAVKRQQSRFRVSVSAAHEPDELRAGAEIIGRALRAHGVTS